MKQGIIWPLLAEENTGHKWEGQKGSLGCREEIITFVGVFCIKQ